MSSMSPELVGKELEILKEVSPKVSRVALLGNPAQIEHAMNLFTCPGKHGLDERGRGTDFTYARQRPNPGLFGKENTHARGFQPRRGFAKMNYREGRQ